MQESLPPLPPPGTSPSTHYEHHVASIQPVKDHNILQLQLPSLEIKIKYFKWKLNPQLHLDLVVVVKKIINSIPAHHLLPPKTSEEFNSIKTVFNRLQDYIFIKGFLIIKYFKNLIGIKRLYQIFACKYHSKHTQNYQNLDNFTKEGSN